MASDVVLKRCGVRFERPAIVVIYTSPSGTKVHRRTMPLRNFTKRSGVARAAEELRNNARHRKYLEQISIAQLERLIGMIRDGLNGVGRAEIIKEVRSSEKIDSEEDLNKVDESTLAMKKAIMDLTFEKNRKKPNDPDYMYDLEIDFQQSGPLEPCDWDDSDN